MTQPASKRLLTEAAAAAQAGNSATPLGAALTATYEPKGAAAAAAAPKLDKTEGKTLVAARRGARYAALGDSLISFGFGFPTAENAASSGAFFANWPQLIALLTKGEIVFTERQGFPGNTTAQILARVPYVISSGVRGAVVLGGANDHNPDVSIANLKLIYAALQAGGVEAIACLIPPATDSVEIGYRAKINTWIQAYAERHNMTVIDLHTPLVQAAGVDAGKFKTGLSYDAIHMNQQGHLVLARSIVPRLQGRIGGGGWRPRVATVSTDPYNLFGDGLFSTESATPGLATGLSIITATGGSTGYTPSRVAAVAGEDVPVGGYWQRMARTAGATGAVQVRKTMTSGFAVGDRIAFSGAVRTSGFEATNTGSFAVQVVFGGSTAAPPQSFSTQWQIANAWAADVSGVFYEEHVIPPGTTAMQMNVFATPGTDATTVDFGAFRMENLTTTLAL
jgi:lysophospholipase L1-like esterase